MLSILNLYYSSHHVVVRKLKRHVSPALCDIDSDNDFVIRTLVIPPAFTILVCSQGSVDRISTLAYPYN